MNLSCRDGDCLRHQWRHHAGDAALGSSVAGWEEGAGVDTACSLRDLPVRIAIPYFLLGQRGFVQIQNLIRC